VLLSLQACAPLQQAPLVYTSGQTIGVKIGAAPTQAEAFEIMIGVKLLDAAYAPVAVARPPSNELSNSKVGDWGIKEIYGVFGEELTPDSHKRLKPEEIRHVQDYLAAAAELKQAESNLQTQENAYNIKRADLDKREAVIRAATTERDAEKAACSVGTGTCADEVLTKIQEKLKEGEADKKALDQERRALSEEPVKTARAEVTAKAKRLEGTQSLAIEALQKLANVRKKDALSVYGSFNSDTNGTRTTTGPGAALKLGKVFSTGVAAQNLSEAERSHGMALAIGACMTSLADIAVKLSLTGTAQESFLKTGMDKCTTLGKAEAPKS